MVITKKIPSEERKGKGEGTRVSLVEKKGPRNDISGGLRRNFDS